MNIDYNKKGIIILTTYRSGGTQLSRFLNHMVEHHFDYKSELYSDEGEFKGDLHQTMNILDIARKRLWEEDGKFKVFLLNNPIAILKLHQNYEFGKISQHYNMVHLTRLNMANGLLSLGLWERLIDAGLFTLPDVDPVKMKNFHDSLIKEPLSYTDFTLGYGTIEGQSDSLASVNTKLMRFVYQLQINKAIAHLYNLPHFFYEEYETDSTDFVEKHFPDTGERVRRYIRETYSYKIPYPSDDYRVYYKDDIVQLMEEWGIRNL